MSELLNYDFTTSSQNQFSPTGTCFLKRNLNGHIKFDIKKFTLYLTLDKSISSHIT